MAEEELENGEEKKSSKKLIIIIAAVVLLLAGGGGAYFFMAGGDDPAAEAENAEEAQEEAEEDEEDEGGKEISFYELEEPLRVPFPKGSSASLIEVRLAFMIDDPDVEELLEKHKPMMINNLLMAISAAGADNLRNKDGKEALRATILDEVNKVMHKMTGKDRVKDVFFTGFVMQ